MIDVSILRFVTLNKIQPAFLKLNPNNNFSSIIRLMFEPEEIKLIGESDNFQILNESEIIFHIFNIGDTVKVKFTGNVSEIVLIGKTI